MSLSNLSDAELVLRWRAGDKAAGAVLVRRYTPRIRRVFGVNGWNSDMVAEKTQQTFLILCENLERIQEPEKVKSFLLGIANNLLRDYYKEKYRPISREPVDMDADDIANLEEPGISTLFSNHRERTLLNRALGRVPVHDRVILQLRYWDELSQKDIAKIMEIPVGTVASRLSAARVRLGREVRRAPLFYSAHDQDSAK